MPLLRASFMMLQFLVELDIVKELFKVFSSKLFDSLLKDETLKMTFSGESSQFIRINNAKIRQAGYVDDADVELTLIFNNRTCSRSFTYTNNPDNNLKTALSILTEMRDEITQLPVDPYIVDPIISNSTEDIRHCSLLNEEQVVDALLPVMQNVDLVGIWASGRAFRGAANSLGLNHWFEADSFTLDYSLVTPQHQMVKGTFSGEDWNQNKYEEFLSASKNKLELLNKKPVKIKPGSYRVWFEPAAVSDFIGMFSWNGVGEASIQQGCSGFSKMRNNSEILSPKFTLKEDFSSGMVPRFNSEGEIAPETMTLIDRGKLQNTLVSSRTAAEYGVESNMAENGEFLRSPKMQSGSLSEVDILPSIDNGLFISNIHYLNWSDNPSGRITGLTRYACFHVERGEVVAPIETMRFDDTFYRFFGTELEAVGKKVNIIPDVSTYYRRSLEVMKCPGILVNSFALTL